MLNTDDIRAITESYINGNIQQYKDFLRKANKTEILKLFLVICEHTEKPQREVIKALNWLQD